MEPADGVQIPPLPSTEVSKPQFLHLQSGTVVPTPAPRVDTRPKWRAGIQGAFWPGWGGGCLG